MSSAQVPVACERAAPARGDALMSDAQLEVVVRAVSARVLEERVREGVERQTSALRQDVRALEEKVAALDRRMQSFADSLQEEKGALKHLEQRLAQAEREGGREDTGELSARMESVEASLQRALTTVMPKVEVLLAQLKAPRTAAAPLITTTTTTSGALAPATRERLGEDLHRAVREGRAERVQELLDAGANVDARDFYECTPLHWAARYGDAGVVAQLLGRGADAKAKDNLGSAALHWAACNDNSGRCVSLLLDADADCAEDNGWPPLHFAAFNGNEAAVRALLAAGADRRARDGEGKTPLDRARSDAVRRLLLD